MLARYVTAGRRMRRLSLLLATTSDSLGPTHPTGDVDYQLLLTSSGNCFCETVAIPVDNRFVSLLIGLEEHECDSEAHARPRNGRREMIPRSLEYFEKRGGGVRTHGKTQWVDIAPACALHAAAIGI